MPITPGRRGGGTGGPPTGPAGGDLTGTYPNPTFAAVGSAGTVGDASNVAVVQVDTKGRVIALTPIAIAFPTALPPNGAAGGDLAGSYPNPTLKTIVTAGTVGDANNVAQVTVDVKGRVTTATPVAINFPTALPPNGAAGGDLTGTYPNPTIGAAKVTMAKRAAVAYMGCSAIRHWALPSSVWTPVPGGSLVGPDTDNMHPINASTTTIAAGSNGVALPTGTINVGATAGFPTAGNLIITGPPGAGIDTVVTYTGVTGTTFTGCTGGTGTLATGQAVAPANESTTTNTAGLYILMGCVAFPAAGNTTGTFGVRIVLASILVGEQFDVPNLNLSGQTITMPGTVLNSVGTTMVMQMWQSSGAALTIPVVAAKAPVFAASWVSS